MTEDMLTVIIPVYCTPKELFRDCMRSILSNHFSNLEVIVVDDGSGEEYQEFLRSYISDSRVRLFFNSHRGPSAARNTGIQAAQGKWVAFADSDDYVCMDTLSRILRDISCFTGDVILFGGGRDNNGAIRTNTTFLKEQYNYGEKMEDKLLIMGSALSAGILPRGYYQSFTYGSPCSKLFNRNFLIENDLLFDEEVKFAEDVLLLMQVYLYAEEIYYYNWYFYTYVNNPQSSTVKYRPGVSDDMKVFFRKMETFLSVNSLDGKLEKPFYVRAEIEAMRCRRMEYMHPDNSDPDRKRRYNAFIREEPFRTALKKHYLYGKRIIPRIRRYLLFHNLYFIYDFSRKIYHMGDRKK